MKIFWLNYLGGLWTTRDGHLNRAFLGWYSALIEGVKIGWLIMSSLDAVLNGIESNRYFISYCWPIWRERRVSATVHHGMNETRMPPKWSTMAASWKVKGTERIRALDKRLCTIRKHGIPKPLIWIYVYLENTSFNDSYWKVIIYFYMFLSLILCLLCWWNHHVLRPWKKS